jgi:tRNA (mo5U34)-methyltransferase
VSKDLGNISAAAKERANQLKWVHTIRLADDFCTPGRESLAFEAWRISFLPKDLTGKSVLDIGCNDGLYSFECERRGASRVLAIDNLQDPRVEETFLFARETIGSSIEWRKMSVYEIGALGETFDLVLFMGVYYHVDDPIRAFRAIRTVASDLVIAEGHVRKGHDPVMWLYKPCELNPEDSTNVWGPTVACLQRISNLTGFREFRVVSKRSDRIIAYLR